MEYHFEQPVQGHIGLEKYKVTVSWSNGTFIADEPEKGGGKGLGPDPYTLLLSSLASCTLATLRMYIDRKKWEIPEIDVSVNLYQSIVGGKVETTLDRDIRFNGTVTEEQRVRLMEIASNCPISKILQGEIHIRTFAYSEGKTDKKIKYAGDAVTVLWKPELCAHSGRCVSGLPKVFDVNAKPWIQPDGAPADKVREQVAKCPTGAISILEKE